jgi:hypothetical protein
MMMRVHFIFLSESWNSEENEQAERHPGTRTPLRTEHTFTPLAENYFTEVPEVLLFGKQPPLEELRRSWPLSHAA